MHHCCYPLFCQQQQLPESLSPLAASLFLSTVLSAAPVTSIIITLSCVTVAIHCSVNSNIIISLHGTSITTATIHHHQYHHCRYPSSPVSPLPLSIITSITTAAIHHHQYHHYHYPSSPVSPLLLSIITSITTIHHHQFHHCCYPSSPVSPLTLSIITGITTAAIHHHQWPQFSTCHSLLYSIQFQISCKIRAREWKMLLHIQSSLT